MCYRGFVGVEGNYGLSAFGKEGAGSMKSTKLTLISRLSFMSLCLFTFSTGTIAQDSGSSEVKAPVLETHEDDLTKPVEKAAKIGSQNPVDSIDEAIKVGEKENEAERIVTQAEIFLYGDGVPVDLVKAAELYEQAVALGSPKAMMRLSTMYRKGTGVKQDVQKAFNLTKEAAEKGYVPAQAALGFLYKDGIGVEKNETLSSQWIHKAAENGHVLAMIMASEELSADHNNPEAQAKAEQFIEKVEQTATPQEIYTVSYSYGHGLRLKKDIDKAMYWATIAAEKGGINAMYFLGECFWNKQNPKEALVWFEKAAEKGLSPAQLQVGRIYRDGADGVAKDLKKAAYWLKKSAALGNRDDVFSLVTMLVSGPHEIQDKALAKRWLDLYSQMASPQELNDMAEKYWEGRAVRRNFDLGGALALAAITRGDTSKICEYAIKLSTPNWVGADYVTAYSLLNQCCLDHPENEKYKNALDNIQSRMGAKEIQAAQSLESNEALSQYLVKQKQENKNK